MSPALRSVEDVRLIEKLDDLGASVESLGHDIRVASINIRDGLLAIAAAIREAKP